MKKRMIEGEEEGHLKCRKSLHEEVDYVICQIV
jgi:hypothetical protein